MRAYKITEETKIPGTDYILEKGDTVYLRPKKNEKKASKRKEAYKGRSIRNSDVDDAFDELMDMLGAETVAQELYNYFDSSELADELVSIYVDYDIESDLVED